MQLSKKIVIISKASIFVNISYKLKIIYKIPLLILIYLILTFKDIQKFK